MRAPLHRGGRGGTSSSSQFIVFHRGHLQTLHFPPALQFPQLWQFLQAVQVPSGLHFEDLRSGMFADSLLN
ncbi:MAG: hypothetical protein JWO82_1231 [Akkermansiaceae bacterium]|nr:hypothetical protein [Akkermansiaceae bacterium]